jgi:hypothetical protein
VSGLAGFREKSAKLPSPGVLWSEMARDGVQNVADRFRFVRATLQATEGSG